MNDNVGAAVYSNANLTSWERTWRICMRSRGMSFWQTRFLLFVWASCLSPMQTLHSVQFRGMNTWVVFLFVCFCTWMLQTVLQFFHARGEGLSLEDMKSGDYKVGTSCNRSAFMSGWKVRLMSSYPLCRLSLSPLWLFSRCFRPWMRSSGWISVPPSSWLNSTIWRRFPIRCVSTYRAVDLVLALEWTEMYWLGQPAQHSVFCCFPSDWTIQAAFTWWNMWMDKREKKSLLVLDFAENTQTYPFWSNQCEMLLRRSGAETDGGDSARCRHHCTGCQW